MSLPNIPYSKYFIPFCSYPILYSIRLTPYLYVKFNPCNPSTLLVLFSICSSLSLLLPHNVPPLFSLCQSFPHSILSPASSINRFHSTPISSGYVTRSVHSPSFASAKFLCNVKIQFGLNELCNICISFTRLTLICSRLCQKRARDFYFSWQSAAKRKRVDPNRPTAATGSILSWTLCNLLVALRVARKGRRRRRRREEMGKEEQRKEGL